MDIPIKLVISNLAGFKRQVQKAATANITGGAPEAAGAAAGGGFGIAAIAKGTLIAGLSLSVLKGIQEGIGNMFDKMKDSSAALKGVMLVFQKAMLIFFKPFGDFLASLLKPMAALVIRYALGFNKFFRELFAGMGGEIGEEVVGSVADVAGAVGDAIGGIVGGAEGVPEAAKEAAAEAIKEREEGEALVTPGEIAEEAGASVAETINEFSDGVGDELVANVPTFADLIIAGTFKFAELLLGAIYLFAVGVKTFLSELDLADIGTLVAGAIATLFLLVVAAIAVVAVGTLALMLAPLIIGAAIIVGLIELAWKALTEMFDGLVNIFMGLGKLGIIISEEIKEWLIAFFNVLVISFTAGFESVQKALNDGIKLMKDYISRMVSGFDEIISDFISAFDSALSGLPNLIEETIDKIADLIPEIPEFEIPEFQTGTDFVPETGLAVLHKGEQVIPAGRGRGGGTNISFGPVIVQSAVIREEEDITKLAEKLAEAQKRMIRRSTSYG